MDFGGFRDRILAKGRMTSTFFEGSDEVQFLGEKYISEKWCGQAAGGVGVGGIRVGGDGLTSV